MKNLQEKGIQVDLQYADLQYADLQYADLQYADLRNKVEQENPFEEVV